MGGIHFPITGDNASFINAMKGVQREINNTSNIVEQNGGDIDLVINKLTSGLAKLGVAFSAQQLIKQVIDIRGEFQQLEVAFTTMLGSAEKAEALMTQLTKTAAITPFGLQDVASGAKQLLAYGISAENVNDTLVRLGDIAAGLSIPLGDLVYLYGTTMTQGRMFTMDLRQFMGRGIPMAEELAKIFGVAKSEVAGLVTQGKVTSDIFAQAIENMTNSGSKFGGLMEAQSKTITGQISNIKDAIDVMFNEIGQSSEGVINTALAGVSSLVENYEKVGEAIAVVVTAYGAEKAALAVGSALKAREAALMQQIALEKMLAAQAGVIYTDAQIAEIARTKLNTIAQQGLAKSIKSVTKAALANPYVAIGAAVAALAYGIYKAVTYQNDYEKSLKKLNEAYKEAQTEITKEVTKLDRLKGKLNALEEGTKEYEETKKELISLANQYDPKLGKEIEKVGLTEQAYKKLTNAIQDSVNARIKAKRQDEIDQDYATEYEEQVNKLYQRLEKTLGAEKAAETFEKFKKLFANRSDLVLNDIIATRDGVRAKRTELSSTQEVGGETDPILEGWRKFIHSTGDAKKITKIIGDLIEARSKYVRDTESLEKKFGNSQTKSNGGSGDPVVSTKNKQYWEDLKKKAEDDLAALTVQEAVGQKGLDLKKKIAEYQKQIDKYDLKQEEKDNKSDEKKKDIISSLLEGISKDKIDLLEEGYDKTIAVIDNAYDKAIEEIDKKAEELKKINKEKGLGEILTPGEQVIIDQAKSVAKAKRDNDVSNIYKELAYKYKSFDQRRRDIDEKYQEDMVVYTEELNRLLSKGLDTSDLEASMEQRTKVYNEEISSLNDEIVSQMQTTELWGKLFGDVSKKNIGSLKKIINETKILLDYLTGVSTVKPENFTDEQLKALGGNVENIKLVFDQYNNAVEEFDKKTDYPFSSLIKGFGQIVQSAKTAEKAIIATGDKKKELEKQSSLERESGLSYLQKGVGDVAKAFSYATEIVNKFAEAIPNEKLKESAEQLGALSSNISAAAEGAASGGWIGAIVGGVTNIISQTVDAFVQAEVEEEEFLQSTRDFVNEYKLMMLDLKEEDYDSIFGESSIRKVQDAYKLATTALSEYNAEVNKTMDAPEVERKFSSLGATLFSGDFLGAGLGGLHMKVSNETKTALKAYEEGANALQGMIIKTKDYSGWANFWGKDDEYASLKDIAPELWDADGAFNVDAAKKFLDTNKQITQEQRNQIQNVIEYREAYEENISVIEDFLNNTFGGLASELSDIIFDSIRNGTDAWSEFEKVGSEVILSLGKQMMQELIISTMFEKYRQPLVDAWGAENPMEEIGKIYSEMMKDTEKAMPMLQQYGEDYLAWMESLGFNVSSSESEDQASRKGFAGMDQDTASELNGRFTALQISGESIENHMFNVVFKLDTMLGLKTAGNTILSDIREAHAITNGHLEDIVKILGSVKAHTAHLESIDNNLK